MRSNCPRWGSLIFLVLAAAWPTAARAVPLQVNVQGVLFDETGETVEGATTISIRLYGSEAATDPLWQPAAALDVLCEAGVFNALVPAEAGEAEAFAAVFADGGPRWIGIAPAGASELSPRIPVVSVPYALVAARAATADVAEVAHGIDCLGCVPAAALDPAVQTLFWAYNGADSGLTATTYQAAIDELADLVTALRADLTALQATVAGLAPVARSGDYADLTGTPDLQPFARTAELAPVALSNAYADLDGLPDLCAEALDCPIVAALQAEVQDTQARLWCLERCDPTRLGDCRARTCDGSSESCTDTGALPDGTACGGGNGRCVGGECFGAFCGGASCPYLPGYRVACNPQAHCEYTPVDPSGWRQWDVWIWVPAGSFMMGAPAEEPSAGNSERPVHEVTFAGGFLIMKYEIVVDQHLACENAERCIPPTTAHWDGLGWGLNRASNGRQNHPQNGLTWQQARDFCGWVAPGGRLPSEAEWEYAASGPVHRRFPWGNTPEPGCEYAVFDPDGSSTRPWACTTCADQGCASCCSGTQPVGSRPTGSSWCGALDMAGNLWEWMEDAWHSDYTDAPVDGSAWVEPDSIYRVQRGGAFSGPASNLRSALRANESPSARMAYLGARCVRPLLP